MTASRRPKADARTLRSVEPTGTVHHRPRSVKHKKPHRVAELNLTAMLDVCFLLLIFFVLTASFAIGEGILPADLPRGIAEADPDDPEPPEQPLEITLSSLGGRDVAIRIEGVPETTNHYPELYQMLRSLQHTPTNPSGPYPPDNPVVIRPDGTVSWGHVVNAFNAALRARYTNVNFAQPN